MGADLYFEEQSFRPRSNRAHWDGNELVIEKDLFMVGYKEFWRGPVNKHNRSLIEKIVKIPAHGGENE